MALVHSLLTAIVRADGDALVLHVGERPYVIAASGTIELSAHGLNLEAMSGMLRQLLPADVLKALEDFGAVEHELVPPPDMQHDRYTVVAARGGDDVWIEIRRQRRGSDATGSEAATSESAPLDRTSNPDIAEIARDADVAPFDVERHGPLAQVPAEASRPGFVTTESKARTHDVGSSDEGLPYDSDTFEIAVLPQSTPEIIEISSEDTLRGLLAAERVLAGSQDSESFPTPISNTLDERPSMSRNNEPPTTPSHSLTEAEEASAVVVPLTRSMRVETGPRGLSPRPGSVARLLRLASSRGASALYLPSQARPYIRAYGDIRVLEEETVLTSEDVEAAVMELAPESARDAVRRGTATEWALELDDLGRILCTTFRDFRGPGALFQMISAKAASADQLGLSRDMQALSTESEGLVVVAGPRASGKSTLIAAFMDLVNRSRSDYVITLERQIRLVHDNRSSTVSQREIRGSSEEVVAQARLAMRENPDVLVIEDIRSPEVLQVALDAAGSGVLVFISVTAPSAAAAVERLLDMVPVERRGPVQALLSETLRGVVSQVLLRKTGGGRVAARELMLATGEVTGLVSEGQAGQLPQAIEHGRKHGMVPLNDALVAFVQSGAVDVREAYRKAADRPGLVALLKREGIDTSFVERLA
jgi:twitching motility protein PilT